MEVQREAPSLPVAVKRLGQSRHQSGLTLLELLITIAIVIIMAVLSVPFFDSLARSHSDTAMHYLMREVQQARSSAVVAGKTVTLCGSEDNESCTKNWQTGMHILVFIDSDANRILDDDERLIRASNVPKGYFQWRGAGRNYLRFRQDGSVREMGTFTYCPPSKKADFARQLTINRPGRSYYSRDRNGDRTHEANNSRDPIACPDF